MLRGTESPAWRSAMPIRTTSSPFWALLHRGDRKSTRLNSSHSQISYAVFCLKKKKQSESDTVYDVMELLFTEGISPARNHVSPQDLVTPLSKSLYPLPPSLIVSDQPLPLVIA